ncbi:NUDIX domain-containing protein [Kitasatospora sp. NPDC059463]|uniref:NUDIX domain-containing protein n=1 Tax=unclassified Kitasatospora TaxID=2633591 RepID=UPI0036CEBC25
MDEILALPPRRRLGHQALILNSAGAVLLVATTYRRGLLLPGGSAERGELPHLAVRRQVEAETGLTLPFRDVLAVDYVAAQRYPEGVNFVYLGGILTEEQEMVVRHHFPSPIEITDLCWRSRSELSAAMEEDQLRRVQQALTALDAGMRLPMLLRGVPAGG